MPISLHRIVGLLVISCLLLNSSIVVGRPSAREHSLFTAQALAVQPRNVGSPTPGTISEYQMAGQLHRTIQALLGALPQSEARDLANQIVNAPARVLLILAEKVSPEIVDQIVTVLRQGNLLSVQLSRGSLLRLGAMALGKSLLAPFKIFVPDMTVRLTQEASKAWPRRPFDGRVHFGITAPLGWSKERILQEWPRLTPVQRHAMIESVTFEKLAPIASEALARVGNQSAARQPELIRSSLGPAIPPKKRFENDAWRDVAEDLILSLPPHIYEEPPGSDYAYSSDPDAIYVYAQVMESDMEKAVPILRNPPTAIVQRIRDHSAQMARRYLREHSLRSLEKPKNSGPGTSSQNRRVTKALEENPKIIFDIGAGYGDLSAFVAKVDPEAHVYSVELPGYAAWIQRVAEQHSNVHVLEGDIRTLNLQLWHGLADQVLWFFPPPPVDKELLQPAIDLLRPALGELLMATESSYKNNPNDLIRTLEELGLEVETHRIGLNEIDTLPSDLRNLLALSEPFWRAREGDVMEYPFDSIVVLRARKLRATKLLPPSGHLPDESLARVREAA